MEDEYEKTTGNFYYINTSDRAAQSEIAAGA